MTNTHFISKVLLISSVFILSSCAKGASIYNEAVDDLKTRLVNPDTMKVISADGYELQDEFYFKINIEALNSDNLLKRGVYYYHTENRIPIFDGTSDKLYFIASLNSESHHYTYK